jgi:hypothetical protein
MDTYMASGKKVSILFHGLMVAKYNAASRKYKVGIVQGAPDHVFACFVDDYDLTTPILAENGVLTFKLMQASTVVNPIQFYTPSASFNRTVAPTPGDLSAAESRYIAEIDGPDLHNAPLTLYPNSFKPKLCFLSGTIKAKELTPFLRKKLGAGAEQPYGYMAEIVELEIPLNTDQELQLVNESGDVLWRCSYDPDGDDVEVSILNMPYYHYRNERATSWQSCEDPTLPESISGRIPAGNFQCYYLAFPKAPADRYELLGPDPLLLSAWPLVCGKVLLVRAENDLDF